MSRAVQLKDIYWNYLRRYFSISKSPLIKQRAIELMKRPVEIYKRSRANESVGRWLGINYRHFLRHGRTILGEETFRRYVSQIDRIDLDCQLLICSFVENQPFMFRVSDKVENSCEYCEHFAAIGNGMNIAECMLAYREHEAEAHLGRAIYHVYEAWKIGTVAPGVGKKHCLISVFYPPKRGGRITSKHVSEKGMKFLEQKFQKLGPKKFFQLPLPEKFFEPEYS
jgi:hypothetical protein